MAVMYTHVFYVRLNMDHGIFKQASFEISSIVTLSNQY